MLRSILWKEWNSVSESPGQANDATYAAIDISVLNRRFDDLIRAATVASTEIGAFLRGLRPGERARG